MVRPLLLPPHVLLHLTGICGKIADEGEHHATTFVIAETVQGHLE